MASKQDPRQLLLRPEVAEKYTATITPCVIQIQRIGRTIDLRRLSVEEADELVEDPQFAYLVRRKAPRRKAAPAVSK